jgi:hypothetical protein
MAEPAPFHRDATADDIADFFARQGKTVVTFLGYAAAEYEDPEAMLRHAAGVLDELDPHTTIVNIGATARGIGAVYELAKQRGFATSGIVSALARRAQAPLSPFVDYVFFVDDASWGGVMPGSDRLSPTSAAIVRASDSLVAIGGGSIARDELAAAHRAGKPLRFIAADMNHRLARERAARKDAAAPTDFRGAAADAIPPRTD